MTVYVCDVYGTALKDAVLLGEASSGNAADGSVLAGSMRLRNDDGGYYPLGANLAEGWVHLRASTDIYTTAVANTHDDELLVIRDNAAGRDLFRLFFTDGVCAIQYYNGSTWTSFAATGPGTSRLFIRETYTLDFHWLIDNSAGLVEVYLEGRLWMAFSGDTLLNTSTTADRVSVFCPTTSTSAYLYLGGVVVADEPTIGWRIGALTPNAGGTTVDWTNTYTNVIQRDNDDATYLESGTAGQIELMALPAAPTMVDDYEIKAVAVNFRAADTGADPQQVRALVRSGGTNYNGATEALANGTWQGFMALWATDPAGGAWGRTALDALEAGVECIT